MQIDAEALTELEGYRLLVGIIAPRPIAWVTSLSPGGVVNAAPFSCFTWVSHKPLMVAIVCGRKNGVAKDKQTNKIDCFTAKLRRDPGPAFFESR